MTMAVRCGWNDVVQVLLANGAKTNARTRYWKGSTKKASDLAARYDDSRMLELLEKPANQDALPDKDRSSSVNPVRVGGKIKAPKKVKDVAIVSDWGPGSFLRLLYPKVALEVTIDTEGRVSTVRPLHSHWLLDRELFDAARQWRFEPTLLGVRSSRGPGMVHSCARTSPSAHGVRRTAP